MRIVLGALLLACGLQLSCKSQLPIDAFAVSPKQRPTPQIGDVVALTKDATIILGGASRNLFPSERVNNKELTPSYMTGEKFTVQMISLGDENSPHKSMLTLSHLPSGVSVRVDYFHFLIMFEQGVP